MMTEMRNKNYRRRPGREFQSLRCTSPTAARRLSRAARQTKARGGAAGDDGGRWGWGFQRTGRWGWAGARRDGGGGLNGYGYGGGKGRGGASGCRRRDGGGTKGQEAEGGPIGAAARWEACGGKVTTRCGAGAQPLKTRGRVTFQARPGLAWGPAYGTDPKPHEDGTLC